jgi:competence protein ComEC
MLQPHNAALAKAILLGQRADLSREVRLQFAQSGVAHILALSGLHLSMLALLLGGAFRILPAGRWLWVQRVVVLVALAGYAVVTGLSPSVVRAVLMAAVLMLGYSLLRPVRILNVVAFCACLQLLLAPRLLFSLSFLLSYTAVIGLVTLGDSLQRLLQPRLKVLRYLWGTVVASVAAQLATLPFVLYYFGDFPLYFLLANLVLLPLMLVLMPLGLLLLLLGTVPYVGPLLALPFDYGLSFMQGFTAWVARLPGSGTLQLPLSALAAWLMGVGLVVLWQWLRLRTRRQLAEEDAAGIAEVGL